VSRQYATGPASFPSPEGRLITIDPTDVEHLFRHRQFGEQDVALLIHMRSDVMSPPTPELKVEQHKSKALNPFKPG
jgi:hypothetical protein